MESVKKRMWTAGISGAVGGIFGATSGSNNLFVVACVSAVVALITAQIISGVLK